MCGIAGFWSSDRRSDLELDARRMASRIASRGPDSADEWADPALGFAMSHRRLSIMDLSSAGDQPMRSEDGRYVLSYNGEIYNHSALRADLESAAGPIAWRGRSDTETLLWALIVWGVPEALKRLNGMFAFALWDRRMQRLTLGRDRMGEKPLYYGRQGQSFLFGSELKALAAHPDWLGRIDRNVLALFLRHNCVPAPYCIFEGLSKLPPAHYVTVEDGGRAVSPPTRYWDLEQVVSAGARRPLSGTPTELVEQLEALLKDAVQIRMAADVPLGAFLSGGTDSSTVVALMQAQSSDPIRTFSIGFSEPGYNEAEHAKAVAAHLGTDHTELYVTPEDALDVIPELPRIFDEPFADPSQIPTFLVSRMAREHVTVCLSGDGGDELFGGYTRYDAGYRTWRRASRLPWPLRRLLRTGLRNFPVSTAERMLDRMKMNGRHQEIGNKLRKLDGVLEHRRGEDFYFSLLSTSRDPASLVKGATEPETVLNRPDRWPELADFRDCMMYLDAKTYLPDDILTKLDRASMAVSLEARVPLLDHRVVEFAFALPLALKLRENQSKWILRQVLYRHVPGKLIDRPKKGFAVPLERWLRGPLRDWADSLLDAERLHREGVFRPEPIRRMWEAFQSDARKWSPVLWAILMFQAWHESAAGRERIEPDSVAPAVATSSA